MWSNLNRPRRVRKCGLGLRSIVILSLVLLLPLSALYSESALDELIPILQSYERATESLSVRLDNSETELQSLKISIGQAQNYATTLENNLHLQSKAYNELKLTLTEVEQTSKTLTKQTEALAIGYRSIERSLKLSNAVNKVLIVAVCVLAGGVVALWVT